MAYNQKNNAGRGNQAKTGAGIPSALTMQDPKDPKPLKTEVKKQEFDNDPVKHFKSFPSKVERMNAKNPYPLKSVRQRKFAQLQKRLKDSSM
jgi:hypothetical protein